MQLIGAKGTKGMFGQASRKQFLFFRSNSADTVFTEAVSVFGHKISEVLTRDSNTFTLFGPYL